MNSLNISKENIPIHILHIDDDQSIQEITKLMLLELNDGLEINWASCVDDAFKKLVVGNYDVVVCDYEMPQKDGLQLLKLLRQQNNKIPFILFTGKGREEIAIKALNLGADGYINKQGNSETVYRELLHGITSAVERKRAIDGLVCSEDKFRAYVENSPVAFFVTNSEGKYVDVNDAACNLLSYSKNELLKLSIVDILYKKDIPLGLKQFTLLKETGKILFEVVLQKKNGEPVDVILNATKLPDGSLIAFCENITELKKNSALLEKNQAELKAIVYNAPVGIATSNSNMRFKSANEAFCRIVGYSEDELQKLSFKNITYPEDLEDSNKEMEKLRYGNIPFFHQEKRYVRKDGGIIDGKVIVSAIRDSESKLVLFVAELEDITQQKQAEIKMRESFEVLERVGEGIDAGLAVIGKDYRVVWANNRLMDLGVTPNKKCYETFNNLGKVCPDCGAEKIFKQNVSLDIHEYKTVNSKGETVWVELRVTPLKDRSGNVTAALELAIPITERKKTEEKLIQSDIILQNSSDSIIVTDLKGKIISLNKGAEKIFGYIPQDIIGENITKILKPDEKTDVAPNQLEKICKGKDFAQLWQGIRKDGSDVWLMLTTKRLFNEKDEPVGMVGFGKDITEYKKSQDELRISHDKLGIVNEKLEVVGSLTRHDVNNKLMTARANLHLLRKKIGNKLEYAKYLNGVDSAIDASVKIFEFSRLYEKIGSENLSSENVYSCFNQAVSIFPSLSFVKTVNECEGLMVVADSLLKQLFYNLIDNSLKHGEKVTEIRLHFEKEGEVVKMFYEDDGVGIPEAIKTKLFEAGFTTGKGSGFGLYLVKKMMDVYGWTISEEGKPCKGAKFIITIPKRSQENSRN